MKSLLSPVRLIQAALVLVSLACASIFLLSRFNQVLPIQEWPLWRTGLIALYVASWTAAIWGVGLRAVSLLLGEPVIAGPRVAISFGVGVYIFFALTFLTGALGHLGSGFFFWGPLLMLVLGWAPLARLGRARHGTLPDTQPTGASAFRRVEVLGAMFALALASCTLLPSLTGYDARWYHLPLAEQYAHTGRIHPYPEGWLLAAYPQMASVLYTWAFLAPWLEFHEHIILATQLEFVCECAGWFAIPLLVRTLLKEQGFRWSWASVFLFPAVFHFRTSGGADHFPALWAVCLFLGTLEAWPGLRARSSALLGLLIGAVLCTKYSSYALLPGLGLALLARTSVLIWRSRRSGSPSLGQLSLGLACLLGAAVLASAPHWLKNLVFYGDPLFPMGRRWFPAHPWSELAERLQRNFWNAGELARPEVSWKGLGQSLMALVDFSFTPRAGLNEIYFGSLFTLSLALLPWLRLSRRVWGLSAWTLSGIFCWYWLHHQDRYLMAFVPWMSAVTVVCLVASARSSPLARPLVLLLASLQALWSLRVFASEVPFDKFVGLYSGSSKTSFEPGYRMSAHELGKKLPEDAVVLVHDEHILLGLSRKTVSDAAAWQGGIDYLRGPTDRQVYETLTHFGVTHIFWERGVQNAWDSDGSYLVFSGFVARHGQKRATSGGYATVKMPNRPPRHTSHVPEVLVALCPGSYASGVHAITALSVPGLDSKQRDFPAPLRTLNLSDPEQVLAEIDVVDAVLVNRSCSGAVGSHLKAPLTLAFRRGGDEGWVKAP